MCNGVLEPREAPRSIRFIHQIELGQGNHIESAASGLSACAN